MARPMPEVEPVTNAVLPCRHMYAVLSLQSSSQRRLGSQLNSCLTGAVWTPAFAGVTCRFRKTRTSRNQVERRGLAVDDVAGEQAVVPHRLGDRGEPFGPMMFHRGAGEFEVAGAALPAMLAVDEVDDIDRMFGGHFRELCHVLVLLQIARQFVEHLADRLPLLAQPDQLISDLPGAARIADVLLAAVDVHDRRRPLAPRREEIDLEDEQVA